MVCVAAVAGFVAAAVGKTFSFRVFTLNHLFRAIGMILKKAFFEKTCHLGRYVSAQQIGKLFFVPRQSSLPWLSRTATRKTALMRSACASRGTGAGCWTGSSRPGARPALGTASSTSTSCSTSVPRGTTPPPASPSPGGSSWHASHESNNTVKRGIVDDAP